MMNTQATYMQSLRQIEASTTESIATCRSLVLQMQQRLECGELSNESARNLTSQIQAELEKIAK